MKEPTMGAQRNPQVASKSNEMQKNECDIIESLHTRVMSKSKVLYSSPISFREIKGVTHFNPGNKGRRPIRRAARSGFRDQCPLHHAHQLSPQKRNCLWEQHCGWELTKNLNPTVASIITIVENNYPGTGCNHTFWSSRKRSGHLKEASKNTTWKFDALREDINWIPPRCITQTMQYETIKKRWTPFRIF